MLKWAPVILSGDENGDIIAIFRDSNAVLLFSLNSKSFNKS